MGKSRFRGLLFSDELKSKSSVTKKVNVGLGMGKPRGRTGFSYVCIQGLEPCVQDG